MRVEHLRRAAADTAAAALGIGGLMVIFSLLGLGDDRGAAMWIIASFGASITLLLACPAWGRGSIRT